MNSDIAWMAYQYKRPSFHSYVILASHISFFLCIATSFKRQMLLEAFSLCLSASISVLYHICDENWYCAGGLNIFVWHALDVWATFFLVCFVLGVMVMDFDSKKNAFIARTAYFLLVTGFTIVDRGSMVLFGSLLGSVGLGVCVRYGIQKHHLATPGTRDVKSLVAGVGIFCLSLGCFVLANTPVLGKQLHDPAAGPKPMNLPDTTVYWFFHSVWHFCSAVSAHFILHFRKRDKDKKRS